MSKCAFLSMQAGKSKRMIQYTSYHNFNGELCFQMCGFIIKRLTYLVSQLSCVAVVKSCCALLTPEHNCYTPNFALFYRALCTPVHFHGRYILHCMSLTSFEIYDGKEKPLVRTSFPKLSKISTQMSQPWGIICVQTSSKM